MSAFFFSKQFGVPDGRVLPYQKYADHVLQFGGKKFSDTPPAIMWIFPHWHGDDVCVWHLTKAKENLPPTWLKKH